MIPKYIHGSWLALLIASLCLWSASDAQGQRAGGGTGRTSGSGGGGGYGGGAGGARSSSSGSTRDYGNSTVLGDANVSYDPETRSMIVVADPKTYGPISNVIANLDRPKPQVLIKVVFLEVTHNDDLDIGVEASYTKNIGGSLTQPGNNLALTNAFGALAQGFSGGNSMPAGAGLYTITGNDFQATVRAIAANGKAEVLSRPSIMVRNNQPANIKIGQRIPIIQSTTYNSVGGGQQSSYAYQDIGILLQVQPFITADGLVQLIVMPEISDLSTETITISPGVNIPVIDSRSASTVVVTPDRQPVVIGGLMGKTKSTQDTKIPLLGDIPWLGYLFKRHQVAASKTELIIFLTPYVVRSPGEIAAANASETSRIEMVPDAFPPNELERYLDGVPMTKKKITTTTDKK